MNPWYGFCFFGAESKHNSHIKHVREVRNIFNDRIFQENKTREIHFYSNAETVYMYHRTFGRPFCPSLNPNHFCTLISIEDERINDSREWYERHECPLVLSKPYIESPIRKKAKHSMKQTNIGFHLTKVDNRLTEDTLWRRERKGSTSGNKKERRETAKEQKQGILSTWMIAGTEEERLKLVWMQEKNSAQNISRKPCQIYPKCPR